MPEVKKQFYRLFKVAKELNVPTGRLVDHLKDQGHEVANTPNTKLPVELYELLLKEFASDQLLKEKAAQIKEQRREEVFATVKDQNTPTITKEEEEVEEFLSAKRLTEIIEKDQREDRDKSTPQTEEKKEEKKEAVAEEKTPPEVIEDKTEVVEEPPAKEETPKVGLKVKGKIDLEDLKRTRTRKKKTSKVEDKPKAEEKEVKEEKVSPPPIVEEETPEVKQEEPVAEKELTKKEESPEKEETPVEETVEETPVAENEEKSEEEDAQEVIRAKDHTPKLSGLKVMGKIDLSTKKNKKKEEANGADANAKDGTDKKASDGDEDADSKKKRRRRKRKRNRSSAVKPEGFDDKKGGDDKKGTKRGKKEKVSEKEVDQSIKSTLAEMKRGASRSRQRLRRAKRDADAIRREQEQLEEMAASKVLEVTEFITANEFANLLDISVNEIITKSFQLGMMVSINQRLDAELLTIIGEEYGYEVKFIDVTEKEFEVAEEQDSPEDLEGRNPIITVMGHVDHGKTTLLDYLRKTNVTAGEAGGITQHIGAYEVPLKSGGKVTFLDTPGHEAFTAMRARGAKVTDIVIIVVAADDAVMPQTKEAINHAQAGSVPMVFAINKIDKEGADPERIKGQLAEMNILVEDWGGQFQSQEISAKFGTNVDELLEKVITEAELMELKANPDRHANGTVIEARLDKGRGNVATVLVQNGTLKVGDPLVAGIHFGKVRALINQKGGRIKSAGPSTPVQVLGLTGQPQAGDKFQVFEDESKAKDISQKRQEVFREQQFRQTRRITLDEIGRRRAIGNFKELNIIVKGDVDGSIEALSGSLLKLSNEEVQVNIILKGTGAINESDVLLASASDAVILAFNVRPTGKARSLAEKEEIDIRTYSVIYDAINDVKDALEGLLSPEIKEEIMATVEVREVFKISRVGNVAGCYVTSGKIHKTDPIRLIRDGIVIYDSTLSSLKRFKDDVKEVASGFECGLMVQNFNDIKVGDVVESYREKEIKRTLS